MEQRLWTEAERLCSLAIQQGLVTERRVMLFMKVKDVNAYLSSSNEFLSAHVQFGVNSSNKLQIYYLYLLKRLVDTPNRYHYINVIQEGQTSKPEMSESFAEVDVVQGLCKQLINEVPNVFDENSARTFLSGNVIEYLKNCQLASGPSPEQKIIDDFINNSSRGRLIKKRLNYK
jgi:hypothetical protein